MGSHYHLLEKVENVKINITKIEKVITFVQILLPKGPGPGSAFLLKKMIKKW